MNVELVCAHKSEDKTHMQTGELVCPQVCVSQCVLLPLFVWGVGWGVGVHPVKLCPGVFPGSQGHMG